MSLVYRRHAPFNVWRRTARIQLGVSFQYAVLKGTFGVFPSVPSRTVRRRIGTGIQQWYHRRNAPRLPRRNQDYSPPIGRFLVPDLIGYFSGLNVYSYIASSR